MTSPAAKKAPRLLLGAFLRTTLDALRNDDLDPPPKIGVRETDESIEFAIFEADRHVMDVKVYKS